MKPHTISITKHGHSTWRQVFANVVFWMCLVTAVGVSRAWFGGAFIIDLAAFAGLILGLTSLAVRHSGHIAHMTRDELRRWVNDGMPENVAGWRQTYKDERKAS